MIPKAGDLDGTKIHVQAPTSVLFVCGGQSSGVGSKPPLSIRDAFTKISYFPLIKDHRLIQAEDITTHAFFRDCYSNLLDFETDLAQITDLIILFCESEGSLAELGAFSVIEEIAERLLVVIRDKHWESDSFVKLGPLLALKDRNGNKSVCVLDDADIGMTRGSAENINIGILKERLQEPLQLWTEQKREATTFDKARSGHVIKLIVGLIQEYGALTSYEIVELLEHLSVKETEKSIAPYLLCAKAVDWIKEARVGIKDFYISVNLPKQAANISLKESCEDKDRSRRRLLIRKYWEENDPVRFRAIKGQTGVEKWAS